MSNTRRGFTLIELLAVIAIIAMLMGLLMPAVQKSREAANRAKCQNNLKQIALAVQLYENSHSYLPCSRPPGERQTWAWFILPDLEQNNLYMNWPESDMRWAAALPDTTFLGMPVPTYFCPSRRSPSPLKAKSFKQSSERCSLTGSVEGSVSDYAAAIGTTGDDGAPFGAALQAAHPSSGAFVYKNGLRMADFLDGTSHTLLVGEKHVPKNLQLNYPWDCNTFDGHNSICSTRSAGPGWPLATSPDDLRVLFGGPHIGVCQFAFVDGSIRPVKTSIDEGLLGLLSHRADGQPNPLDY